MSLGRARRRNQRANDRAHKSTVKHTDENRFEQQNRAFFARVHAGFRAIAARESQRVVAIDASGSPPQTHRRIMEVVARKLKLMATSA
jgi:dTMP kinase